MIAYKYRGGSNPDIFNRDLDSISGDYFYAASLAKLNDPFEATYIYEPIEKFIKVAELLHGKTEDTESLRAQLQETLGRVNRAGIFSLAKNFDDTKLWAHYADRHTGFCVGYDIEQLEKHNGDAFREGYIIKVKYSRTPPTIDFKNFSGGINGFLQRVLGIKHPDWAHEAETRIITDNEGGMAHDFRAIKTIHFGLNMPQEQIDTVMQRMQGRQIAYYKMQKNPATYSLTALPIADIFSDAPRYLDNIAPVTDYALATDPGDEERIELLPYLQKAVEIQRKEPYCSEVDYVGASLDKAKAGQIWVNYRYKGNYFNRHFTKAQIEELYAQIADNK